MEAEKTRVSFRIESEANDSNQVNAKRNFSATIEDERNQLEEIKIMSGKENICEQSKSPSMLHVQSKLHQNKSDMNQHPSIQPLQPTKTQYIRSHMANKLLEHYGKLSTHLTLNIFDLMATH